MSDVRVINKGSVFLIESNSLSDLNVENRF